MRSYSINGFESDFFQTFIVDLKKKKKSMNKVSQSLDLRGGGIRGGAWLTGGGRNGGGGMFGGSGPGGKKGGGILAGSASELGCSEITYKSSRHMIQFPDVSSMSVLHRRLRRAWEHVMCVTWMLFPSRLWRRRPSTLLMVAVCPPITSMVPGVFLQQIQTYTSSFMKVYIHFCVFQLCIPDAYITHTHFSRAGRYDYTADDIFVHQVCFIIYTRD